MELSRDFSESPLAGAVRNIGVVTRRRSGTMGLHAHLRGATVIEPETQDEPWSAYSTFRLSRSPLWGGGRGEGGSID